MDLCSGVDGGTNKRVASADACISCSFDDQYKYFKRVVAAAIKSGKEPI
jgi:hypothetical protein